MTPALVLALLVFAMGPLYALLEYIMRKAYRLGNQRYTEPSVLRRYRWMHRFGVPVLMLAGAINGLAAREWQDWGADTGFLGPVLLGWVAGFAVMHALMRPQQPKV